MCKKSLRLFGILGFAIGLLTPMARASANPSGVDISSLVPQLPIIESSGSEGRRPSPLRVSSVRWTQSQPFITYDIDDMLGVTVNAHYAFQIVPEEESKADSSGRQYYSLRIVVLRPKLPQDEESEKDVPRDVAESYDLYQRYVAGTEQLVTSAQGVVQTRVTLKFHTVSALSMRNTMLIQMVPVDGSKLVHDAEGLVDPKSPVLLGSSAARPLAISVPFVPRVGTDAPIAGAKVLTSDVRPEERLDLGLFYHYAEKFLADKSPLSTDRTPLETAHLLHVQFADPNGPEFKKFGLGRLAKIPNSQLEIDEKWAQPFCQALSESMKVDPQLVREFNQGHIEQERQLAYRRCLKEPESSFDLIQNIHTLKMNKNRNLAPRSGGVERITMTANFTLGRQHSQDASWSLSQNFSPTSWLQMFFPLDLGGAVSLGVGYSVSRSDSRSRYEGMTVSRGTDIEVQNWNLAFDISEYQICYALKPRIGAPAWRMNANPDLGLYFCGEKKLRSPITAHEQYFYIMPGFATLAAIDIYDPSVQIVNLLLRGERDYEAFQNAIRGSASPVQDRKLSSNTILRHAKAAYQPPALPGILSTAMTLRGPLVDRRQGIAKQPTLTDYYLHRHNEEVR